MFTGFTISGASLKLLKVGERGVIARVKGANPAVADQLRRLGLSPGTSITLEQRFPRFVLRTHKGPLALTQTMIQSIYVRTRAS
ncbi:MAG: ferrous iron transport protein A [Cyanobacteria bacterium P01_G01_bin.38]